jgi:8-oxo-dGTP pyrophosphatase MutT (NUDIX family)
MKTCTYRVVIETEASGKKWYYAQKRHLIFFWRYLRFDPLAVKDKKDKADKIRWHSFDEAEAHIQADVINNKHAEIPNKIVRREYIRTYH